LAALAISAALLGTDEIILVQARIPQYPFQAGEVVLPSDINYKTLTVAGALKKMQEVQLQIANPQN
jgi:hypothetical protein